MLNPKINLLPYREEKKKAIKVRYFVSLGIALALGLASIGMVHTFYSMQMTNQEARNGILETDISSLDKQIEQIKKLRQEIAAAVARKQVVESLQANRSRAVMVLNQIVQPPANIFYRSVKQVGEVITLTGIAPSNTSVSALIKQIEASDVLFDPKLVESKSTTIEGTTLIEFSMSAKLINLAKAASDKNVKKAAAPTVTTVGTEPASPNMIVPSAGKTPTAVLSSNPAVQASTTPIAVAPGSATVVASTGDPAAPPAAPKPPTATLGPKISTSANQPSQSAPAAAK